MTIKRYQHMSKSDLANLARKKGVARPFSLSRDQLLKALLRGMNKPVARRSEASSPGHKSVKLSRPVRLLRANGKPTLAKKPIMQQKGARRDTTQEEIAVNNVGSSKFLVDGPKGVAPRMPELPRSYGRDRIVVMVRDPFWLHAYWELTEHTLRRAEAALEQEWHHAKLILRMYDVTSEDTSNATESVARDIVIHHGCNNWYIDVNGPPRSFRIDIGYLTKSGRFYMLCRSNIITTPRANMSDQIDENWAEVQQKLDKIYALSGGYDKNASSLELRKLFEERLRRPMSSQVVTSLGSGAFGSKSRKFFFNLDAELIIYGSTEPTAKVMIQGEPVQLRPDGSFTMRVSLPDGRQILPAVAYSADGVEERTIVLAVERNTKALEPMIHEANE
jgi:hypothetical protein